MQERAIDEVRKIVKRLGGTAWEVAEEAGLFPAYDDPKQQEKLLTDPAFGKIEECIRVAQTEALIREKYNAHFWIERIAVDPERAGENVPPKYRKLYAQVACLRKEYPMEYREIWHPVEKQIEDERTAVAGIAMDEQTTYAVCRTRDGRVRRIPAQGDAFWLKGYGSMMDTGMAASRIAVVIKKVLEKARYDYGLEVERFYVALKDQLPEWNEIRKQMMTGAVPEGSPSLLACEELCEEKAGGEELVRWAGKIAADRPAEYLPYEEAVMNVYGKMAALDGLKAGERVLLYDFSERELTLTLMEKEENGTYAILDQKKQIGSRREQENAMADVEDFLLTEKGLRDIGINGNRSADQKAFAKMRGDWEDMRRQLIRCDAMWVVFDNGYLRMVERYPVERYRKKLMPALRRNDAAMELLLTENGMTMEALSAIVLAGEECEYPLVQEHLIEYTGKKICVIDAPEYAGAKGAALSGYPGTDL